MYSSFCMTGILCMPACIVLLLYLHMQLHIHSVDVLQAFWFALNTPFHPSLIRHAHLPFPFQNIRFDHAALNRYTSRLYIVKKKNRDRVVQCNASKESERGEW